MTDVNVCDGLFFGVCVMYVDSDNSPQTSKAVCSTVEQEQSIDEILGLQVKHSFTLLLVCTDLYSI